MDQGCREHVFHAGCRQQEEDARGVDHLFEAHHGYRPLGTDWLLPDQVDGALGDDHPEVEERCQRGRI